ncbi:MAG: sigma-70 family RNA polymerase sigma factor [Caldisericia bacterium]|nr:sigma-70 family RNA polymerase sigma factor [Caldisericia bacterium]MDD5689213.1 sigma-70 family RNA polymerase sigma factor [Caldisericia bacterium]HOJ16138.1 sigma-70 family RNA polymerase sigma factor [Caldisericia bacterium]HOW02805.1 sigma-70 family RNA polymerase sigma factor [Caldisericia bacterium]HPO28907.1 sigma-70 family RNA polymerase sigma factor [Caldisericia bacterium]
MSEEKELFENYFIKYKDDVYRVAYYYTRNSDEAEDLVQDTFIRAYKFFSKFKKNTNFKSWILKIMRNIYITKSKKKSKENNIKNHEVDISKNYSLENDYLDSITISDIRDAILMLPREFREVIILSDISGLMYEDIAKIIKVPVGTVRSRLHRGRLILKERLKEKYDTD